MFGLWNNPAGCSPILLIRGAIKFGQRPRQVNALNGTNLLLLS
jgi:hypothetical protein